MKILMINLMPLSGSGSGVYVINLANSLLRQGHEVCCIFPDNESNSGEEWNFKIHPIYFTKDDGTKPGTDAPVVPFNFPCFTTHPRSTFNCKDMTDEQFAEYQQAFRDAIAAEMKEFQPDVIHSGHIWATSAVAAEFDVPLVITCHGTDIQEFQAHERYHEVSNQAAAAAKSIICISPQNLDLMVKCFPDHKDKAVLMPNGYDPTKCFPADYDQAEVLAQFGITKTYQHVVSFAGKYTHFKGIDVLLKAAAQYEDGKTATVLAGDGVLFNEMKELAKSLNLRDTYLLGYQDYKTLAKIYNIAEVSLVPSRGEPFGLVVIEAGACGTPVIGTNDGGIKDILTPKTGILINPDDPDALAREVKAVLSGEKKFDRDYIAKYTKETFSQDSLIEKLVELYEKACQA